ncbi:hypothetical protein [Stenotrophomonas sp. YIM B06876]|uniref:hypothetical protein n=1 Tax=Stenotrophomonas sp. YIM B06876 TaxID=3060211 RepID=UPI0027381DAE|nr:hypothetical protein [Stenotrophomonas sp. YIM B06876]
MKSVRNLVRQFQADANAHALKQTEHHTHLYSVFAIFEVCHELFAHTCGERKVVDTDSGTLTHRANRNTGGLDGSKRNYQNIPSIAGIVSAKYWAKAEFLGPQEFFDATKLVYSC